MEDLGLQPEMNAVTAPVDAIGHCEPAQGCTARGILPEMLRSDEERVDWLETRLETIGIIGAVLARRHLAWLRAMNGEKADMRKVLFSVN